MPPSVTPGEKPKRSPWDLSREDLAEELSGEPRFRLDQIWHGLYDTGAPPDQISTIPVALRTRLSEAHPPALRTITEQRSKSGDTIKWLFALPDGAQIETVLMHYKDRSTACVSSQAGCAMACSFCATGQAGFERHLSAGEILEQIILAREAALPNRLSNVVFMGMGEPLANLSRLTEAIDRVTADMGIGARRITVSTVGLIPAMIRFAELKSQVGLAVSLHAANDDLRTELVPINKRYPISDLVEACLQVRALTTRRVSFEWAMINGVNDRDSDVAELAAVAKQARAHVNLIPLNPTPGYPVVGTSPQRVRAFAQELRDLGVNTTVRANMGTDIDAACGQLSSRHTD